MKALYFLLTLFIFISCTKEKFVKAEIKLSEIDSLDTNNKVEEFIGKTDSLYRKFSLKKVQDIKCHGCDTVLVNLANRLKADYAFFRADLDNNGYTDLVATGVNKTYISGNYDPNLLVEFSKDFNALVLMNFGKDKIKLYNLTDGLYNGIIPTLEYIENRPFLTIYKPRHIHEIERLKREELKTELTFKFDAFVEYNPEPISYKIEKIEYSTTGCMGMCPIFLLSVSNDGAATFEAAEYNYTEDFQMGTLLTGTFTATVPSKELNELKDLLNYIDFVNLKNRYDVLWTDDQTAILKITYNNGKTKTITDYGLKGTYGLIKLHDLIFKMRINQGWTKN